MWWVVIDRRAVWSAPALTAATGRNFGRRFRFQSPSLLVLVCNNPGPVQVGQFYYQSVFRSPQTKDTRTPLLLFEGGPPAQLFIFLFSFQVV